MKKLILLLCTAFVIFSCSKDNLRSLEGTVWQEQTGSNRAQISFDSSTVCRYGFVSEDDGKYYQLAKGTYEFSKGRVEFNMKYKQLFGNIVEFDYAIIEGDVMSVSYDRNSGDIIPVIEEMTLKRIQ